MDFEVNGREYHSAKMNAMDQFQVLRRLSTIMGPFVDFMRNLGDKDRGQMSQQEMLSTAAPLVKAISELSDEVTNYIFDKCLSLVARKEMGDRGYAKIWNVQAKRLQMEDIDLSTMMQILLKVIEGSFEGFFPTILPNSTEPPNQRGGSRLNS